MKSKTIKKNQKGQAALLIVLITMTSLLFVALTLTNVVTKRTKMTRDTSQSVQAYYLADTGEERLLYLIKIGDIVMSNFNSGDTVLYSDLDADGDDDFKIVRTNESSEELIELKITGYCKNATIIYEAVY